ncbi:oxygen-independent coproporphyrinogen III oxidase [Nitrosomonas sp.]|uniref:oxygen-independent coproporphyrinogen III oxidase n=1 Tax=Nitrosomonas sp. TaxID=42353 RepID=UPI0025EAF64A|nr:oxygen-independent coproporphyrinogen III oxidase [Nitrosomonas sp.]
MLAINSDLFRYFGVDSVDYRLYPAPDYFIEAFDVQTYLTWLGYRKSGYLRRPLSLYVHIPFCSSLCFFCHCNQIVSRDRDLIENYLDYLLREIRLQGQYFKNDPRVEQIYFGGGTPTVLQDYQLNNLMKEIRRHFNLTEQGEFSIEIDSRLMAHLSMHTLKEIGFNCAIIGVQDFDQSVQQSIHRIQTEYETLHAIDEARQAGFKTVRAELIFGLPNQTVEKLGYTLGKIIGASPDQICLSNYNYLPEKYKPQRQIDLANLPGDEIRQDMQLQTINQLLEAGYVHIGMNHYAQKGDSLALAQRQGRLHYGLQGYSAYPESDHIAMGISAIGSIGPTLSQNHCDLTQYYDRIERNIPPIMRGIELSADDLIRRSVMQALICHSVLIFESMETFFQIEFKSYFATELKELLFHEQAGLITLDDEEVTVTPKGQLVIGSICKVFDKYLRNQQQRQNYSAFI